MPQLCQPLEHATAGVAATAMVRKLVALSGWRRSSWRFEGWKDCYLAFNDPPGGAGEGFFWRVFYGFLGWACTMCVLLNRHRYTVALGLHLQHLSTGELLHIILSLVRWGRSADAFNVEQLVSVAGSLTAVNLLMVPSFKREGIG